jgi:hypothetical protein
LWQLDILSVNYHPSKTINIVKDLKQRAGLQNAEAKAKFQQLSAGASLCLMISIPTSPSKLELFAGILSLLPIHQVDGSEWHFPSISHPWLGIYDSPINKA